MFTSSEHISTYSTHSFHPYSAKYIPKIPQTSIKTFSKPLDLVLDPFCGSGTTLVEAKLLGRKSIGVDLNPIAVLISKAKTTKILAEKFNSLTKIFNEIEKQIDIYYSKGKLTKITYKIPSFYNRDHWFPVHVQHELAIIKYYIESQKSEDFQRFLKTGFSAIINQVSNQESETRYAAIEKQINPKDTFNYFKDKISKMKEILIEFNDEASEENTEAIEADSRKLKFIKDNSVDLIVTSPPYMNTYDYYLYHKMRMFWLGRNFKSIEQNEIGSRHRYSSKRMNPSLFYNNLTEVFQECYKKLKLNKYAIIVIGDSKVQQKFINMDLEIQSIFEKLGFSLQKKFSYNLDSISRTFNPQFATKGKKEHILIFQKK